MNTLLLFLSILPVLVLMKYIYSQDKFEKEPVGLLAKSFIGGIVAIPLTILLVFIINRIYISQSIFYSSFMEAGVPEECAKFTILFLFIWKNKSFDEYMDGIVYAVFVGLGFACVENIMYVFSSEAETAGGGISTGIARALLSVPGHFLFAVIMGYFFSLAKFTPNKRPFYLICSLGLAILAHGLFDFLLMTSEALGGGLSTIIYFLFLFIDIKLWKIGLKYIKKHQLKSELQSIAWTPF
jgi:Predicted membrane protein